MASADRLSEDARRELLERIKQMEFEGYELEAAEGTFELLVREALHPGLHFFEVDSYEVSTRAAGRRPVAHHRDRHAARTGWRAFRHRHGPRSVQRAASLPAQVPAASCIRRSPTCVLTDYKVRVLDSHQGTAAKVRVLIEWSDHRKSWTTAGVSDNVIEASWTALVDAIRLELMRLTEKDQLDREGRRRLLLGRVRAEHGALPAGMAPIAATLSFRGATYWGVFTS